MFRVFGLTGGIGTGKSTVSKIWAEAGLSIVDADALAREVVQPGRPGLYALVDTFGEGILYEGGLDRKALAEILFFNKDARAKIEEILHPFIDTLARQRFLEVGADNNLICYDCPLLFETGLDKDMRPVVVVECKASIQIKRVAIRNELSIRDVRTRIKSQLPLSDKIQQADFIINNDFGIDILKTNALQVLEDIRKLLTSEG